MELYEIANPCGRPRKFKTANDLWSAFVSYAKWNDANPIARMNYREASMEGKDKTKPDAERRKQETTRRPMSLYEFCMHAEIRREWSAFKATYEKHGEEFRRVINAIENTIRGQQISGALVGNYKENLVARLNGIADNVRQEVKADVKERRQLSVDEAREFMKQIEQEI